MARDVQAAHKSARKALDLAQADADEVWAALTGYRVAWLIMCGGDGPTFAKRDVVRLLQQAKHYDQILKQYGYKKYAHSHSSGASPQLVCDTFKKHWADHSANIPCQAGCMVPDTGSAPADPKQTPRCAQCDMLLLSRMTCAGCRRVQYCNQTCQRTHWKVSLRAMKLAYMT
ncbi:hypothetical protein WJX72_009071 [[Myrmecia] bisecta]|uniref:MYND-type domain-containing protein n=1 Tax=[Myrmecia] bisecta TaxID=41462 RepID=A0AAW1R8M4_9CHLO